MKMKHARAVLILLGILVLAVSASSQDQSRQIVPRSVVYPNECGYRLREMTEILRKSKLGRPVIIVSHLATGESSRLSDRRLFNAKAYLTSKYFDEPWPGSLIVIATGERVSEEGYLDFFLEGELTLRILLRNKNDLYLGDCGGGEEGCSNKFEKQFFPCKNKE